MAAPVSLLYVDDEPDNLVVFKTMFRREFEITTSDSPVDALSLLSHKDFDIIISDQRMPAMTGVALLEQALKINRDSVRILFTGFDDIQTAKEAINRGQIFYYLSKPWNEDQMRMVLLKAMDHAQLIKDNNSLVKRLTAAVHDLETFLYRASHDLRSPITSQLGLINLLRSEMPETASVYLHKMEEVVVSLQSTIDKINQLSQLGNDKLIQSQNHVLDLQSIVNEILEHNAAGINHYKIEVEQEISTPTIQTIHADKIKLVLSNLIENSVRFVRPAEYKKKIQIRIHIHKPEDILLIEVTDNGMGIKASQLEVVFNAFYRGTNLSSGNGLGLYVVKKITDLLNGKAVAISDGTSWSTFKIEIPLK